MGEKGNKEQMPGLSTVRDVHGAAFVPLGVQIPPLQLHASLHGKQNDKSTIFGY